MRSGGYSVEGRLMAAIRTGWTARRPHRHWWRLLWAVVLLLHAPATLNAFSALWRLESGEISPSSLLTLAGSNLFFILEIAFASSLRLLSSRRNLLVFFLIIAILHVGVVERSVASHAASPALAPTLLATAVGAACWRRILQFLQALLGSQVEHDPRPRRLTDFRSLPAGLPARRQSALAWLCAPLRAPPCLRA
jgi:hypothetical protein